ncbi:MAG: ATP-binding protein [Kiritimatiellae bacterium]|nr:ATP-binding protein [Kiritimatiellia bacterium]
MKRLVEEKLLNWKASSRRKPLIIRGARQVGKSWLVENTLAGEFENLVKVDLEKEQSLRRLFEGDINPQSIVRELEVQKGRIIPGKTLLFIDEIQQTPRAIMALRYFYEQMPDLHVVAAGSLLEFAFGSISVPVGRVQYLHLHPMTFYEYLLALGKDVMAEELLKPPKVVSTLSSDAILSELRNFFFVGGMPECISVYKDSNSFNEVFQVQGEILESYRQDFAKYKPSVDISCLDAVLRKATLGVGEQVNYASLCRDFSGVTNRKAYYQLVKARVLHKVPSSNPSGLPLAANLNGKKFKTCMLDIGLMQRLCEVNKKTEMAVSDLLAIYRGKLAEQFVAQELIAWHGRELYYWSREQKSSNAEVDYLAVKDGLIYPVEVKSGAAGKLRSLHLLLKNYPACPQGMVLQSGPYRELPEQKLFFLPLYATSQLGDQSGLTVGTD